MMILWTTFQTSNNVLAPSNDVRSRVDGRWLLNRWGGGWFREIVIWLLDFPARREIVIWLTPPPYRICNPVHFLAQPPLFLRPETGPRRKKIGFKRVAVFLLWISTKEIWNSIGDPGLQNTTFPLHQLTFSISGNHIQSNLCFPR